MKPSCLRHTEIPGTSRLFADFSYHFDRVAGFYARDPWNPDSAVAAAAAVDYPDDRRAAAVAALSEINPAGDSLRLLARPGTVAVVTGQQVGLFGGPAYSVYKAWTAIRAAERLRSQGVDAVPVFWLATEDHDFDEVSHAWTLDSTDAPVRHSVSAASDFRPVGGVGIAEYPTAALRAALSGLPFAGETADLVESCYQPGRSMGEAFLDLMSRLFAGAGLLFLDPMRPSIRQIAAPLLSRAVEGAADIHARLLERNAELEKSGYHAQVHVEAKSSLFFLLDQGRRIALRREAGLYQGNGHKLSPADLAARGAHISPNALLRPVVQDFLLPTAALVGGPAELAYLAQTQVIYQALDRPMPVVMPRAGFTLIGPRAGKLLDRYRMGVRDLLHPVETVRETVAGRLVPSHLRAELEHSRASIETNFDKLHAELTAFDPTLASALSRSRGKIVHQLGKVAAKTGREILRRDARAASEAEFLVNHIYPGKHPQERFYTILPFLARHGFDLIGRVGRNLHLDCPDHVLLPLS